MTRMRYISTPIVAVGLALTAATSAINAMADEDTIARKSANDANIGPFIEANVGPFIVKHQGTTAAWVMNTNTGSIRLCESLRSRAQPKLDCSGWSDPGLVGAGTTPMFATASIDCGEKLFTLSTGTANGNCTTKLGSDGLPAGGECNDGMNSATVTCVARTGFCTSSGAGSCVASPSFEPRDKDLDTVSAMRIQ